MKVDTPIMMTAGEIERAMLRINQNSTYGIPEGDPPIIRMYMNTWKEVLNFTKMIKPVCSKIKYPDYISWLNGYFPVMMTVKWDGVPHRYDIWRNLHTEHKEWKEVENGDRVKNLSGTS